MGVYVLLGTGAAVLSTAGVVKCAVDMYDLYHHTDKVLYNLYPSGVSQRDRFFAVMARAFFILATFALACAIGAFCLHLFTLSPGLPLLEGIIKGVQASGAWCFLAGTSIGCSLFLRSFVHTPQQN